MFRAWWSRADAAARQLAGRRGAGDTGGAVSDSPPRLAELVGALSLATDLAAGLAYETALRTCLLAVRLGRVVGVQGAALQDVYYTGLLRFVGCTAYAHETAARFGGDDMALLGALTPADTGSPVSILATAVRRV